MVQNKSIRTAIFSHLCLLILTSSYLLHRDSFLGWRCPKRR